MRTEEDIYDAIELYKENLHDHHIFLNEPIVTQILIAHYQTIIATLEWVLNEPKKDENLLQKNEDVTNEMP